MSQFSKSSEAHRIVSTVGEALVITTSLIFGTFELRKVKGFNPMHWDTAFKYTIFTTSIIILQQIFSILSYSLSSITSSLAISAVSTSLYLVVNILWVFASLNRYEKIMIVIPGSIHSWIIRITRLVVIGIVLSTLIVYLVIQLNPYGTYNSTPTSFVNVFITTCSLVLLLIDVVSAVLMSYKVISMMQKASGNQPIPVMEKRKRRFKRLSIFFIIGIILIVLMDVGAAVCVLVLNLETTAISIVFIHILVTFQLLALLRNGVEFATSGFLISKGSKKHTVEVVTELSSIEMSRLEI